MDPKQHNKILDNTLANIQAGVFDSLKALENRIAELVAQGADVQTLRPTIIAEFEQYAEQVKQSTKQVTDLSADVIGDRTKTVEDEQAESALTELTANDVANTVKTGSEGVITALALGAAAGATTEALVKQARASVSGVFMETNDATTRRAQRALSKLLESNKASKEEVRQAVKVIRERLSDVNVTNSVRDLTSKKVNDAVMKFDGAFTKGHATRRGIKKFRYEGGLIRTSRDWCADHQGEVYTEEEIYEIWNDSWPGKEPGDPFVVRGGYNCRHFWVPVEDDE